MGSALGAGKRGKFSLKVPFILFASTAMESGKTLNSRLSAVPERDPLTPAQVRGRAVGDRGPRKATGGVSSREGDPQDLRTPEG